VQHEPFSQWVIEDLGIAGMPDWAAAGAILSRNVDAYERAKLRLLNGAHSTLAYLGLLAGHGSVSMAMDDSMLAGFVETMMRRDIAPGLPGGEIDLDGYISAVLARFRNKGLVHTLAQIAYDGSQKLPYRLLPSIIEARKAGRDISRLALAVAGWMRFVVTRARAGEKLVDPLAAQLERIAQACSGNARRDTALFLGLDAVFPPELAADSIFRQEICAAYEALDQGVAQAILAATPAR
jgi:fructuronate reductase